MNQTSNALDVIWNCPNCHAENLDNFHDTTFPLCESCEQSFWWDDLLTSEQFNKLNPLHKIELDREYTPSK